MDPKKAEELSELGNAQVIELVAQDDEEIPPEETSPEEIPPEETSPEEIPPEVGDYTLRYYVEEHPSHIVVIGLGDDEYEMGFLPIMEEDMVVVKDLFWDESEVGDTLIDLGITKDMVLQSMMEDSALQDLKDQVKEASEKDSLSNEEKQEYFDYLEELRESGVTNMFGAGAYLEKDFGLSRQDAQNILLEWMKSYEREASERLGNPRTDEERLRQHFGNDWKNHNIDELPPRGTGLMSEETSLYGYDVRYIQHEGENTDFVGDGFECPSSLGMEIGTWVAYVEDHIAQHQWGAGATKEEAFENLKKSWWWSKDLEGSFKVKNASGKLIGYKLKDGSFESVDKESKINSPKWVKKEDMALWDKAVKESEGESNVFGAAMRKFKEMKGSSESIVGVDAESFVIDDVVTFKKDYLVKLDGGPFKEVTISKDAEGKIINITSDVAVVEVNAVSTEIPLSDIKSVLTKEGLEEVPETEEVEVEESEEVSVEGNEVKTIAGELIGFEKDGNFHSVVDVKVATLVNLIEIPNGPTIKVRYRADGGNLNLDYQMDTGVEVSKWIPGGVLPDTVISDLGKRIRTFKLKMNKFMGDLGILLFKGRVLPK